MDKHEYTKPFLTFGQQADLLIGPHPSNKMFFGTIVLRLLLGEIAPQSKWQDRWEALLTQYSDIPAKEMGYVSVPK